MHTESVLTPIEQDIFVSEMAGRARCMVHWVHFAPGALSAEDVHTGLRKMASVYPIMTARIRRDGPMVSALRFVTMDEPTVAILERDAPVDPQSDMDPRFVDARHGERPLNDFTIIRSSDGDVLRVRTNHVVCDGIGLLEALRTAGANAADTPTEFLEARLAADRASTVINPEGVVGQESKIGTPALRPLGNFGGAPHIRRCGLPLTDLDGARSQAGVSRVAWIAAAFSTSYGLLHQDRVTDESSLTLKIPINVRNNATPFVPVGNLLTSATISAPCGVGVDVAARTVDQQLKPALEDRRIRLPAALLRDRRLPDPPPDSGPAAGQLADYATVSFLGRSFELLNSWPGVREVYGGVFGQPRPFFSGGIIGDRVMFQGTFPPAFFSAVDADRFIAAIAAALAGSRP